MVGTYGTNLPNPPYVLLPPLPPPLHLLDYAYTPPTYSYTSPPFSSGSFGTIYRAFSLKLNRTVILKSVTFGENNDTRSYSNEVRIHSELNHPSIVTYIDSFIKDSLGWIVLSDSGIDLRQIIYEKVELDGGVMWCANGVWRMLRFEAEGIYEGERGKFLPRPGSRNRASNVLKKLLKNLTTATSYLHTLSSVHLDIKPSNIFCNYTSPSTIETVTCLLGDFGSGMKMIEGEMIDVEELKDITREYAPPEVVYPSGRGGVDLRKYDSWSLGVTILELLLGTPNVFSIDSRTEAVIELKMRGEKNSEIERVKYLAGLADYCLYDPSVDENLFWPSTTSTSSSSMVSKSCTLIDFKNALHQRDSLQIGFNSLTSEKLLNLIWRLLQYDPGKRMSVGEAVNHPYFGEFREEEKEAISKALEVRSKKHTITEEKGPQVKRFKCPGCDKSFGDWNSCHVHVNSRKHGSRCIYEYDGRGGVKCLSAHVFLPVESESGFCDIQGRRNVIEDFHSTQFHVSGVKYYGLFDGHNGNLASKFSARNLYEVRDIRSEARMFRFV
ncbi:hypothetical protein TL16_g06288 [Triparma laevis f. inornata]|uniref:Protein kinase domain-containing protein n=1 Tax=Triparma laevis f. inornata TaxID=1714386 RepID=A0A9W7ECM0_9STRA|nr:hypothetical protein TL16_g06288 [Triparma laevis f. inornata]